MFSALFDWINRMARKWLWLLALVPYLTDLIASYIPQTSIPPQIAAWLKLIGTWPATFVFASIGFVAAAFLVHRDMRRDVTRLQAALDEAANAVPRFSVGLTFGDEPPTGAPAIRLARLPEPEDLDALVDEARRRQWAEWAESQKADDSEQSFVRVTAWRTPKADFEKELDVYLRMTGFGRRA